MSNNKEEAILILGVGNILMGDEGLGVHAVNYLEETFSFPPNIRLMDGGTLGIILMDSISSCDKLYVLDAVRSGEKAGTVYKLKDEALRKSRGFSDSMHQLDLLDALNLCEITFDKRPTTIVYGIEPTRIDLMTTKLSEPILNALPKMCQAVIDDLQKEGYSIVKR